MLARIFQIFSIDSSFNDPFYAPSNSTLSPFHLEGISNFDQHVSQTALCLYQGHNPRNTNFRCSQQQLVAFVEESHFRVWTCKQMKLRYPGRMCLGSCHSKWWTPGERMATGGEVAKLCEAQCECNAERH